MSGNQDKGVAETTDITLAGTMVVEIDAMEIAQIISHVCKTEPSPAIKAANNVLEYLIKTYADLAQASIRARTATQAEGQRCVYLFNGCAHPQFCKDGCTGKPRDAAPQPPASPPQMNQVDYGLALIEENDALRARVAEQLEAADKATILALRARNAELETGLRDIVDRLDEIAANDEFKSVWTLHHVHGGDYRGPTWVDALNRARAALEERA